MPIFVILHYLSFEMTVQAVDSLRTTFQEEPHHIIIVDNGSPNGSGIALQQHFKDAQNCTVLVMEQNLGFAQGNNFGYRYALIHFQPEYLVVMNNDVLISDPLFFSKVRQIEKETNFHVLGPDIFAPKAGVHQNPMYAEGYSPDKIRKIIAQRKRWLAIYPVHFTWKKLMSTSKQLIKRLLKITPNPASAGNPLAKQARLINPVLHGACYIFSKNFFSQMPEPFDPGTFLYFEEDILHYTCMRKHFTMVYDSSVSVTHMEDISTNIAFKNEYQKRRMKYRNLVHSAQILLDRMNTDS